MIGIIAFFAHNMHIFSPVDRLDCTDVVVRSKDLQLTIYADIYGWGRKRSNVTINLGGRHQLIYQFFHESQQTSNLHDPWRNPQMLRKQYNTITIKELNYLDYILFFYDSGLLRCWSFHLQRTKWVVFMMWYPKMKSFVLVLLCFISSRHVQNN
jgi:hypothetical protein